MLGYLAARTARTQGSALTNILLMKAVGQDMDRAEQEQLTPGLQTENSTFGPWGPPETSGFWSLKVDAGHQPEAGSSPPWPLDAMFPWDCFGLRFF